MRKRKTFVTFQTKFTLDLTLGFPFCLLTQHEIPLFLPSIETEGEEECSHVSRGPFRVISSFIEIQGEVKCMGYVSGVPFIV